VLSHSLLLGFPYADVPEMGSAALVVTDANPALAARLAAGLGEDMWGRKEQFAPTFISPRLAVNAVLQSADRVLLLDMGDNIGGGSPGHGTLLLEELQNRGVSPAFVCLYDPESVQKADAAGVGASVHLSLGGEGDGLHGGLLMATCRVISLHDGKFKETAARHGGFLEFDQGRTAVVETERGITVMLTSRRVPPFSLEQLHSCGIDPKSFRVLVAKGVIAPLAAYGPVVDRWIMVNTPGVTCADMTQLPFHHRRRPMFPFERDLEWKPLPVAGHRLGIPLRAGTGGDTGPVPFSNPPPLLCPAQ
jgi:microcystin degradation protein MlrC